MRKLPVLLLLVVACDNSGGAPPAPPAPPSKPEPAQITVRHILISFKGTRTKATRTKEEAKALAGQLLEIVKKGEDFAALMRAHSDDNGPGVYTMVNHGQSGSTPGAYPRGKMARAFGDVGFKLEVKGIGMAEHDHTTSPFGWHIIQRVD